MSAKNLTDSQRMELKKLAEQLNKKRAFLELTIAGNESSDLTYRDIVGEVHDTADESFASSLSDTQAYSKCHAINTLSDVNEALQRIKEGRYGRCIDCKKDIDSSRLQAYPEAKRCLVCKEKYEALRSHAIGHRL